MTALPISRLICSHDFYWSRKRQADVCRRCGALSPVLALHFRSKTAWTVGADLPPERGNGFEAPPAPPALSAPVAAEPVAQIAAPTAQIAAVVVEPPPTFAVPAFEIPAFDIPAPEGPAPVEAPPSPSTQIVIVELTPTVEPVAAPAPPAPQAFEPAAFQPEPAHADPFSLPIPSRVLTDFSGRDAAPLLRPLVT